MTVIDRAARSLRAEVFAPETEAPIHASVRGTPVAVVRNRDGAEVVVAVAHSLIHVVANVPVSGVRETLSPSLAEPGNYDDLRGALSRQFEVYALLITNGEIQAEVAVLTARWQQKRAKARRREAMIEKARAIGEALGVKRIEVTHSPFYKAQPESSFATIDIYDDGNEPFAVLTLTTVSHHKL